MRVYVAGSMYSPGIDHVRSIQGALRTSRHEITYDWTAQPISDTGDANERRNLAEAERTGVLEADLLILLDHNRPRGALIEMGMALGTGKDAWVLVEDGRSPSLFYHLPNCTIIASPEDLLRAIELLPDEPECRYCAGKGYHERTSWMEEEIECTYCDGTGIE